MVSKQSAVVVNLAAEERGRNEDLSDIDKGQNVVARHLDQNQNQVYSNRQVTVHK